MLFSSQMAAFACLSPSHSSSTVMPSLSMGKIVEARSSPPAYLSSLLAYLCSGSQRRDFISYISLQISAIVTGSVLCKEIADGTLHFASQGGLLQPSVSIIRSEGNRKGHPRRNASADRTVKGVDRLKDSSTTSDETSKSSGQEKIIALFKRIQTSISKRGSTLSKRRSPNNPKEKQTGESVLGSRQKYVKQKQARDKVPSQDILSSGDETTEDAVTSGKFKISRPVSNFAKRSPIPPPSLTPESIQKVSEERLPAVPAGEKLELQKLDEMKLPELKELARKRGVKGYSKLKKGELLELLKGLLQSS